jgi:polyhydroxybutyrate depolymerase
LGDRDVRFFDRVFAELQKRHKIDSRRVYVVGHSNGGRFVHVLWKTRGEVITAIGSVSGHGGQLIQSAPLRSVFMVAGERDRLVPYQGQLLSIGLVRSLLKTDQTKATVNGYLRSEPGLNGTELVTYLHPGGHEWPPEVSSLIVEFFKRTSRK